MTIRANIVNIKNRTIQVCNLTIKGTKIQSIEIVAPKEQKGLLYIMPGFIDSHIHIESSMLTPSQFARMAVVHGTVATVSDPHEIANVCGMQGVEYMIADGKTVPFYFYFGAPSCVPATNFETAGAAITVADVAALLQRNDINYLSEMMNFPGVLNGDKDVIAKLALAHKYNKPIDGHAPGLRGDAAKQYIETLCLTTSQRRGKSKGKLGGLTCTDHECTTYDEALEKLQYGMKILIREGSAAKNFNALIDLLHNWDDSIMFCSDDKHPDSLAISHINALCARAVAHGIDVFKVLKAACINPVKHYNLKVGQLKVRDTADFIMVDNLTAFNVKHTFIKGKILSSNEKSFIETTEAPIINNFTVSPITTKALQIKSSELGNTLTAIVALDGELITNKLALKKKDLLQKGKLESNTTIDILKIVVVNRYTNAPVAKAFIKNFGIQKGAIASSVAHDSHNIVAVGVDDESICKAINLIINAKGGLSYAVPKAEIKKSKIAKLKKLGSTLIDDWGMGGLLQLPVAGLMTNIDGYQVAEQYTAMEKFVKKKMGATLQSPYMTLSFMALLVIPHLKLSDKGLFDGDTFSLL